MAARYFEGIAHAAVYAKFRPVPPKTLVIRIIDFVKEKYYGSLTTAVDIGCGSGQSTKVLSPYFTKVYGLDVSPAQIHEAICNTEALQNLIYKESPAETLPFVNESVQLVTAAQAVHWFDLPKFYMEVQRILKKNGVLAVYGYNFPQVLYKDKGEDIFKIIMEMYVVKTAGYWGSERHYVDNNYTHPSFHIPYQDFTRDDSHFHDVSCCLRDVQGYISTWSGFQNFKKKNGDQAGQQILDEFLAKLMSVIDNNEEPENIRLSLRFPFFLLMART